MKRLILNIILIALPVLCFGQNSGKILERKVSISVENEPLKDVLKRIEKQGNFDFAYSPEAFDVNRKISIQFDEKPIKEILEKLFEQEEVECTEMSKKVLLHKKSGNGKDNSVKTGRVDIQEGNKRDVVNVPLATKRQEASSDTLVNDKPITATKLQGDDTSYEPGQRTKLSLGASAPTLLNKVVVEPGTSNSITHILASADTELIEVSAIDAMPYDRSTYGPRKARKFSPNAYDAPKPDVLYGMPKSSGKRDKTRKEKPEREPGKFGLYGASTTGITPIGDEAGILMGGRAAWMKTKRLGIGLAGYAYQTSKFTNDVSSLENVRNSGGYGGLLIEYTTAPDKPVHLTFPIMVGGGGATYAQADLLGPRTVIESKAIFVLEPGVELEFNVIKWIKMSFGVTYRYTSNVRLFDEANDQELLSKAGLNGLSGGLTVKFGIFK